MLEFVVKNEEELLTFLYNNITNYNKKQIKYRLFVAFYNWLYILCVLYLCQPIEVHFVISTRSLKRFTKTVTVKGAGAEDGLR